MGEEGLLGRDGLRLPGQPARSISLRAQWEIDAHDVSQLNGATSQRELVSFGYHVPALTDAAQIDLAGPNGLLGSLT